MERCSIREFRLWQAYAMIEPFGNIRGDIQAAIIAQTVANVHRGRGQRSYKIQDFMPKFDRGKADSQTPDQMLAVMQQYSALHNEALRRRGGGV